MASTMDETASTLPADPSLSLPLPAGPQLAGPTDPTSTGSRHPTLARFLRRTDTSQRLLVVHGPEGTGRHWFAVGWTQHPLESHPSDAADLGTADQHGVVLTWSSETATSETIIQRIRVLLTEAPPRESP